MQGPGWNAVGRCQAREGKGLIPSEGTPSFVHSTSIYGSLLCARLCVRCLASPPLRCSKPGVRVGKEELLYERDSACSYVIED